MQGHVVTTTKQQIGNFQRQDEKPCKSDHLLQTQMQAGSLTTTNEQQVQYVYTKPQKECLVVYLVIFPDIYNDLVQNMFSLYVQIAMSGGKNNFFMPMEQRI